MYRDDILSTSVLCSSTVTVILFCGGAWTFVSNWKLFLIMLLFLGQIHTMVVCEEALTSKKNFIGIKISTGSHCTHILCIEFKVHRLM